MSEAVNAGKKPWIAYLDKEASYWGEGMCESVLAIMLKDLLLSDSDSTAADTARLIDNYYEQEFLPSDPLMKFLDDKGIGGFLTTFYELVFNLARLIPYNNSNQEKLVQLILELRKLPPRQLKIWEVCKAFYALSSVLLLILRLLLGGLPCLDSGTNVCGVDNR